MFKKPNDTRALQLMDHAAKDVMTEYPDIVLAFGESDEFRWALKKLANLLLHSCVRELPLLGKESIDTQILIAFPNWP